MKRLSGWWRLWVFLSVLWGISPLVFGYKQWPTRTPLLWGDLQGLNPENRALLLFDPYTGIANPYPPPPPGFRPLPPLPPGAVLDKSQKSPWESVPDADVVRNTVTMPDGNVLTVTTALKEFAQWKSMTEDYTRVQDKKLIRERVSFLGWIFLLWTIPCITILALGLGFRWVVRGFRKEPV